MEILEKQNDALKRKLDLLNRIELKERLAERESQAESIKSAEYCAACYTPVSPDTDILDQQKNKVLKDQLTILDAIYNAEQKITREVEVQISLEERKEAAYFKKYGQTEGMRAIAAGIDLSSHLGTRDAYARGESYTRTTSTGHTISYSGNKSGI